ncbi:hypothetical protein [Pseudonocardia sp. MH-G8]|nr:hypothetical protein [Pseudonocardia sp. MH-G8]
MNSASRPIDLDRRLRVIRTVIEAAGRTPFEPYPKSTGGPRTVPMPA